MPYRLFRPLLVAHQLPDNAVSGEGGERDQAAAKRGVQRILVLLLRGRQHQGAVVAHLDADGFLFITDRKKELLKTSGGKLVAPQPIENNVSPTNATLSAGKKYEM